MGINFQNNVLVDDVAHHFCQFIKQVMTGEKISSVVP